MHVQLCFEQNVDLFYMYKLPIIIHQIQFKVRTRSSEDGAINKVTRSNGNAVVRFGDCRMEANEQNFFSR
jgi:hypothetical protein